MDVQEMTLQRQRLIDALSFMFSKVPGYTDSINAPNYVKIDADFKIIENKEYDLE